MSGRVYLVGAGPGDPGLCTVRGAKLLARADVVIADRLASGRLLDDVRDDAEIIVRGRRSELDQAAINRLLVERARAGKSVVRLKGGDPFLFGRGGEEAEALALAGIAFEVVPGVTAALAAPAYAGIPLTHRGLAASVTFATGHESDDKTAGHFSWNALRDPSTTGVLYMSVLHLDDAMRRLIEAGRSPATPAALIEHGTLADQRTLVGTIGDLAELARRERVQPPALAIIGDVVSLREKISWFEARPLRGKRILCLSTRALEGDASDDEAWARLDALAEFGVEVRWVSPLAVEAHTAELALALTSPDRLRRFGWMVLTSRHAVAALARALEENRLDARVLAGVRVASLERVAESLRAMIGVRADLVVRGGGFELAQAMIATGERAPALYPRAAAGRDELPDLLRADGFEVNVVVAYETHPDARAIARAVDEHRRARFDAIAFTSPRGAAALLDALPAPHQFLVGAIGATTASALEDRGLTVAVTASSPSPIVLLEELARELARPSKIR